jgi:hypothetical protein
MARVQKGFLSCTSVDSQEVYIIDGFFSEEEGVLVREFAEKCSYSRNSYGSATAIANGEKPAKAMNGRERWTLFNNPPEPMRKVYQLLSSIAQTTEAEIALLPWDLSDGLMHNAPAVVANYLEEASVESMELGKHKDSDPSVGLPFGIPVLYEEPEVYYTAPFQNGSTGCPYLLSLMLYVTAEDFNPDEGLGTVFYDEEGKDILHIACRHMRLVIFESDIVHSIEKGQGSAWRVSYVFKLRMNPKRKSDNCKNLLQQALAPSLHLS